jgi:hypothetical protein
MEPFRRLKGWLRASTSLISCEGSMPQYRVMPGPGRGSGWVGEQREQGGDRGSSEGKPEKEITFEM